MLTFLKEDQALVVYIVVNAVNGSSEALMEVLIGDDQVHGHTESGHG
jgi:hypothetical protein